MLSPPDDNLCITRRKTNAPSWMLLSRNVADWILQYFYLTSSHSQLSSVGSKPVLWTTCLLSLSLTGLTNDSNPKVMTLQHYRSITIDNITK